MMTPLFIRHFLGWPYLVSQIEFYLKKRLTSIKQSVGIPTPGGYKTKRIIEVVSPVAQTVQKNCTVRCLQGSAKTGTVSVKKCDLFQLR